MSMATAIFVFIVAVAVLSLVLGRDSRIDEQSWRRRWSGI